MQKLFVQFFVFSVSSLDVGQATVQEGNLSLVIFYHLSETLTAVHKSFAQDKKSDFGQNLAQVFNLFHELWIAGVYSRKIFVETSILREISFSLFGLVFLCRSVRLIVGIVSPSCA